MLLVKIIVLVLEYVIRKLAYVFVLHRTTMKIVVQEFVLATVVDMVYVTKLLELVSVMIYGLA